MPFQNPTLQVVFFLFSETVTIKIDHLTGRILQKKSIANAEGFVMHSTNNTFKNLILKTNFQTPILIAKSFYGR